MATIHIDDSTFKNKVLESDLPVLVDFWAPWCGPCRMAEPVLESLSEKYAGKLIIAKINIDDHQQVAGEFGVMSIPTVILYKDGKEIDRQVGFAGESGYEKLIEKVS